MKNDLKKDFKGINGMNIVFIICHDIGRHLGIYHKSVESPNLENFAKEGVCFTNAFCNSPACTPSRCCVKTGKYANTSGGVGLAHMGWPLSQDQKTIVDYFNEGGYETAHFGLNHERDAGHNNYSIDGEKKGNDWLVENVVDRAIKYLNKRDNSSRPFFLDIGTIEAHTVCWEGESGKIRLRDYGEVVSDEEVFVPGNFPDAPIIRSELAKLQTSIKYMDRHLGRLFKKFEELGLYENSVIVFTTDHGIPGMRSKRTLYDKGVETALLVRAPFIKSGMIMNQLIQNIDIAPTLLEAAGIEIPPDMQGSSFQDLLKGDKYCEHEEIFTERNFHDPPSNERYHYDPMRSIRTKKYHYIRNFKDGKEEWKPFEVENRMNNNIGVLEDIWPAWPEPVNERPMEELFDIIKDPDELCNLAYDPQYSKIKKKLSERLDRWMIKTNDFLISGDIPKQYSKIGWPKGWDLGIFESCRP